MDFEELQTPCGHSLETSFVPPLIRGLGSRFPKVHKDCFLLLHDMAILQGTRYSATPVAAKWVAALLDYPWVTNTSDILRFLTVAGLCTPEIYLLAGCGGRFDQPQEQAAYDEMSKHTVKYIRLAHEGDEETRLAAIFLLAMLPGQWRSTLSLLADIACDIAQPLAVRASALSALSFVAPVHDSSSVDPTSAVGSDNDTAGDSKQERLAQTRRAIAVLSSFLPPLSGEVVALRDAAAACVARVAEATRSGAAGGLSILPEELQRLVAHHSLANNPATRRYFQRHAALGMCRLALRARRVSGREQHLLLQSFRPPESSTELELELQLELQRWLPAVKQVLIDCILDPAAYDIEGADTRFRRPGLEQLYLTKYNLLGDDVASEMRCLFMAKLGDPGVSERTLAVVVDELIDLAFPRKWGLMRIHQRRSAADHNVTDWNDDQRQVMSAIVRNDRVWWNRGQERELCDTLQDRLDSRSTPSRHSLARALGIDLPEKD